MTIQEYYDKLAAHDWYYSMSDDPRVYREGTKSSDQLRALAKTVPGGEELRQAFRESYFSQGKTPLPPRPPAGMDDPMF